MPQYAMQGLTDTDRNNIFVLNTFHKLIFAVFSLPQEYKEIQLSHFLHS